MCGACSTRKGELRYVFGEFGFVSGRVRRVRFSVGTCSARSGYCRDVFGEVCLVTGHVRRGRVMPVPDRRGLVIVGTCWAKSA